MNKSKLWMNIILVAAALTLSACGKKDSSFKARYTTNAMGASAIDPARNQAAAEAADVNGYKLDVVSVTKGGQSYNGTQVSVQIMVNNTAQNIYTVHNGENVVQGSVNVGGLTLQVHALCTGSCDTYYLMVSGYQGGREIIQEGIKKSFYNASQDRYQWFQAGQFMPFWGGSYSATNGMIGYLNSK